MMINLSIIKIKLDHNEFFLVQMLLEYLDSENTLLGCLMKIFGINLMKYMLIL